MAHKGFSSRLPSSSWIHVGCPRIPSSSVQHAAHDITPVHLQPAKLHYFRHTHPTTLVGDPSPKSGYSSTRINPAVYKNFDTPHLPVLVPQLSCVLPFPLLLSSLAPLLSAVLPSPPARVKFNNTASLLVKTTIQPRRVKKSSTLHRTLTGVGHFVLSYSSKQP